jgi:tRNA threonylcarbamoyladenosine biosynthesis protein TsaB
MTLSSLSNTPPSQIKLLGVEASTDVCSVAVSNGTTVFSADEQTPKAHTKVLLAFIDRLLKEASLNLHDFDAFVVGRGPGSFTGVRIACSAIQALAYAANKPVIPVSTLRILAQGAYQATGAAKVMSCLRSRANEKYAGLFVVDQCQIMQAHSLEWVKQDRDILLPDPSWQCVEGGAPKAVDLITLANHDYQHKKWVSALQVKPVYLSRSSQY